MSFLSKITALPSKDLYQEILAVVEKTGIFVNEAIQDMIEQLAEAVEKIQNPEDHH
jgi:hypothetical protein